MTRHPAGRGAYDAFNREFCLQPFAYGTQIGTQLAGTRRYWRGCQRVGATKNAD